MQRSTPRDTNDKWRVRRDAAAIVGGAALILVAMIGLAGVAVAAGMMDRHEGGGVDLNRWLALEIVGGAIVGAAAGLLCGRVAHTRNRAVLLLAGVCLTLGLLESLEILRAVETRAVVADRALTLAAPFVIALAVLAGGLRLRVANDRVLRGRLARVLIVPALFAAIGALTFYAVPRADPGAEQRVLSAAFGADLMVMLPAFVYFVFVRTKRAPLIVIAPTVVIGLVVASLAIPRDHQIVVDVMRFALIPAELALLGYLIVLARRSFASGAERNVDFVNRLRASARDALGARLPADVITTEVSILYYALNLRPRTIPSGGFTVYRETGYPMMLAALSVIVLLETVGVHLLVSLWSPVAAWVLTGLSLYAVLWLVGDFRAMRSCPISITGSQLLLRVGLRWEGEIPLADIRGVSRSLPPTGKPDRSTLVLAVAGSTNVRLELVRPIEFIGPYGIRREVTSLHLHIDDADAFCERLRLAIVPCDVAR